MVEGDRTEPLPDTYPLDTYPLGHIPLTAYTLEDKDFKCPIWLMQPVLVTF